MHLWCGFYLARPTLDEPQVDILQSVINELLPQWSRALRVAKGEESPASIVVGREGRLHDCLRRIAASRRGIGRAVLTGAYNGLSLFLRHADGTLPAEINKVTLETYGLSSVEGEPLSLWARSMVEAISCLLPTRYANAYLDKEYAAKNRVHDEEGVRAIGPNLADGLPGLYWLNFFGAPYVELMGRQRLLSAPAYEVKPVGDGVLIALDSTASAWQNPEYKKREQEVIEHLGKKFFFSRHEPDRELVAPDFRSHRDSPGDK
jgi:hypothetical protein